LRLARLNSASTAVAAFAATSKTITKRDKHFISSTSAAQKGSTE